MRSWNERNVYMRKIRGRLLAPYAFDIIHSLFTGPAPGKAATRLKPMGVFSNMQLL